ncbi:hypothetical protein SPOG_05734 [Schizosaccharomyces cryophilus OY26]|uniref:Uncharacterized protein n=1 Tax=Schizosaccharomyces cryophilus (strain OY26 / ATCC MYA-4695 / CBS 11777 / NBRC 106824 / NRRL Y48691) TaxID=653667 RepID=S9VX36_SCHCR|nr:uncharacterized protein SPOG_05734 [Schizosaccharomyces cryophilus OY26]EPY52233.1 hypothetical protein SPOG_05734 [Schizosaccharomyces cryophilus OY26]
MSKLGLLGLTFSIPSFPFFYLLLRSVNIDNDRKSENWVDERSFTLASQFIEKSKSSFDSCMNSKDEKTILY